MMPNAACKKTKKKKRNYSIILDTQTDYEYVDYVILVYIVYRIN